MESEWFLPKSAPFNVPVLIWDGKNFAVAEQYPATYDEPTWYEPGHSREWTPVCWRPLPRRPREEDCRE